MLAVLGDHSVSVVFGQAFWLCTKVRYALRVPLVFLQELCGAPQRLAWQRSW